MTLGISLGQYGLFLGIVFGGLLGGLQYMILRFWLWRSGVFPWRGKAFLEDARARILLQRIGRSYSFIHGTLLDHFADLGEQPLQESDEVLTQVSFSQKRVKSKRMRSKRKKRKSSIKR